MRRICFELFKQKKTKFGAMDSYKQMRCTSMYTYLLFKPSIHLNTSTFMNKNYTYYFSTINFSIINIALF